MRRNVSFAIFSVLAMLVMLLSSEARAEPRIALVIGNSNYAAEIGAVPHAAGDAKLIAETLTKAGFEVMEFVDIDQKRMKRAIARFGDKLADAGPTATGLFFFSGHGVQVDGQSDLIPLNAQIEREADVGIEAVSLGSVLMQMEFAGAATNILVIDASRNNPFQRSLRSGRGLADESDSYPGAFISYSAAPGTLATDGHGPHSPYVTALATPGQNIPDLFQHVRAAVLAATENHQVTWDASTMAQPFFFVPSTGN